MTTTAVGTSTGGKPVNLLQLQGEFETAGVTIGSGIGLLEGYVHTYDADGVPADFGASEQPLVDATIAAHIALRDKTSAEYATEFQDANTTPARRQEIRDIQNGLMPPEQVPITQEEWDKRMAPVGVA